jgi:excisionase family DNA binding protein
MNDFPTIQTLAYGISDACRVLGIGRTRLYALIGQGKIEARACGGRTLIPADSLRAFLASLPVAAIGKNTAA